MLWIHSSCGVARVKVKCKNLFKCPQWKGAINCCHVLISVLVDGFLPFFFFSQPPSPLSIHIRLEHLLNSFSYDLPKKVRVHINVGFFFLFMIYHYRNYCNIHLNLLGDPFNNMDLTALRVLIGSSFQKNKSQQKRYFSDKHFKRLR